MPRWIETSCPHCDRGRIAIEVPESYDHDVDDDTPYIGDTQCEACQRADNRAAYCDWRDDVERRLDAAAEAAGWARERVSDAQTGTRYVTYTGAHGLSSVVVRIGDHATAHAHERYSLVHCGGGPDDHTVDDVERFFAAHAAPRDERCQDD